MFSVLMLVIGSVKFVCINRLFVDCMLICGCSCVVGWFDLVVCNVLCKLLRLFVLMNVLRNRLFGCKVWWISVSVLGRLLMVLSILVLIIRLNMLFVNGR